MKRTNQDYIYQDQARYISALITRKEFLTLPMPLRRKILSRATDDLLDRQARDQKTIDESWEHFKATHPDKLKIGNPTGICNECGRKTWTRDSVGVTCLFPQPGGTLCHGEFEAPTTL